MKMDCLYTKISEKVLNVYSHKKIVFLDSMLLINAEMELENGQEKLIEINLDLDTLVERGVVCINDIIEID